MLAVLGCALQLAAATPPLVVRSGDRVVEVVTTAHPAGGLAVHGAQLAAALGGRLARTEDGRLRFEVAGTPLVALPGGHFVATPSDTFPLPAPPVDLAGQTWVPRALVADILPRAVTGVLYDEARGELRRFAPVALGRRGAPAAASVPTVAAATVAASTGTASARPAPAAATTPGARRRTVVVDAGHGGPDAGMTGPIGGARKVREKDITLAVSLALRAALEERGVAVVMTRTRDTLIALADRGRIANRAKADLFVSVHVNAANPNWRQPGTARGFETYFLAEAKTEDERRVEAMENEAIRFEAAVDSRRDDPLGFIIRDMAQNEHLRESARLAESIQGGLRDVHPGPDRGVKQAGFRVLVSAFMPAVLVELGFGTNADEVAWMTDPRSQRALAARLADAIVSYLAEYERRIGAGP
jgi:N-acetylmuramoyl-L-alanine amidase